MTRLPLALFCFALFWSPIPLGSYRPWAWDLLALLLGTVMLLILAVALWRRSWPAVPSLVALASCAYAGVVVWALVQALLPVAGEAAHPVYAEPAIAAIAPGRIAMAPLDAVEGAIRLSLYGMAFWIAICLGAEKHGRRAITNTVLGTAVLVAVYGLWRLATGDNTVFGLYTTQGGVLTGTFANRNHAAMYLNLALMLALARLGRDAPTWRERPQFYLAALLDHLERHRFLLLTAALLAVASLLTASKGGVISLACGLVALVALGGEGYRIRRLAAAVIVVGLALAAGVQLFGSKLLARLTRLLEDPVGQTVASDEGRWQAWEVTVGAIKDRPLQGHGLGSFGELFLMYRPAGFDANYLHAHNLYLELAAELGLPATAALLVAGIAVLAAIARLLASAGPGGPAPARGALAAATVVAVHSLVDFGIQIPANALVLAVLLGVAVGGGQRRDGSTAAIKAERRPAPSRSAPGA